MMKPIRRCGTSCATIARPRAGNHQLADALQRVAQDQPVDRHDALFVGEAGAPWQHREGAGAEDHAESELVRHRQAIAHFVIQRGQNWAESMIQNGFSA